jgi:hypothetical protein
MTAISPSYAIETPPMPEIVADSVLPSCYYLFFGG